jgi:hypothetical protein
LVSLVRWAAMNALTRFDDATRILLFDADMETPDGPLV